MMIQWILRIREPQRYADGQFSALIHHMVATGGALALARRDAA
jgi:hypothetical protein